MTMFVSLIILIVLSTLVFFIGFHVGLESTIANHCGTDQKSSTVAPSITQLKAPPCNTTLTSQKPRRSSVAPPPLCHDLQNCTHFVYRKGANTVPETIFPFLHHPASPAKSAYFLTHTPDWKTPKVEDSPCQEVYLTRTGSRASQPNKCVSIVPVINGFESINQQSHRVGYTALNTDQYQQDYPRDYNKKQNNEKILLHPFLKQRDKLIQEIQNQLGVAVDPSTGRRKQIILMVANGGVVDLLVNFLCSSEGAKVDIKRVLVFVGDVKLKEAIERLGSHAIYDPSLGSMPSKAAGYYLDHTFSRMMWFKAISVYLTLMAGYDVLFQDVDLVWLKDPFDYFESLDYDILFMDDGARTPRYTPFFVNSGFYFIKYNPRTLYLFEKMTKAAPSEIGQTHSHQSVLIRHIAEAHHLFGLKVFVLDNTLFPSGQAYHENKPLIKKIQKKTFQPFVFHMCWTDNRENKVVYFKEINMWYINEAQSVCASPQSMLNSGSSNNKNLLDLCCRRDLYWSSTSSASSS